MISKYLYNNYLIHQSIANISLLPVFNVFHYIHKRWWNVCCSERLTAEQCLKHAWLQLAPPPAPSDSSPAPPPVLIGPLSSHLVPRPPPPACSVGSPPRPAPLPPRLPPPHPRTMRPLKRSKCAADQKTLAQLRDQSFAALWMRGFCGGWLHEWLTRGRQSQHSHLVSHLPKPNGTAYEPKRNFLRTKRHV